MQLDEAWITASRPGYLGKARDTIRAGWDATHGKDRWRLAWELGDVVLDFDAAMTVYEDAFFMYAREHPEAARHIGSFIDVYDTAPTNVAAGFSYTVQETPSSHLHDVAWRRVLRRLGYAFNGEKGRLLEIRWKDSEGYDYNPGVVPFHLPELISQQPLDMVSGKAPWWEAGTVEDWYQKNKLLQVR